MLSMRIGVLTEPVSASCLVPSWLCGGRLSSSGLSTSWLPASSNRTKTFTQVSTTSTPHQCVPAKVELSMIYVLKFVTKTALLEVAIHIQIRIVTFKARWRIRAKNTPVLKRLGIRNQPNAMFASLFFLVRICHACLMKYVVVVNKVGLVFAVHSYGLVRQKLHDLKE